MSITAGLSVNALLASNGIKRLEVRTGLVGDSAGICQGGDFTLRTSDIVVGHFWGTVSTMDFLTLCSRLVDLAAKSDVGIALVMPSLLKVTFEMDDVSGFADALLLRFVKDSLRTGCGDIGLWLKSKLLRLALVEVIFTGEGRGADALVGEHEYTGFENNTPLVGVSFHGFAGPLISVTFVDGLFGNDNSSSASPESLKLDSGELKSL